MALVYTSKVFGPMLQFESCKFASLVFPRTCIMCGQSASFCLSSSLKLTCCTKSPNSALKCSKPQWILFVSWSCFISEATLLSPYVSSWSFSEIQSELRNETKERGLTKLPSKHKCVRAPSRKAFMAHAQPSYFKFFCKPGFLPASPCMPFSVRLKFKYLIVVLSPSAWKNSGLRMLRMDVSANWRDSIETEILISL